MKTTEVVEQLRLSHADALVAETSFWGQIKLEVRKENLMTMLMHLKRSVSPSYSVLMDLTGIDYLYPEKQTKVIYLLHNPTNFERLIISVSIKRNEVLSSVTQIWEGADWYERELYDLFGVQFEGHPDMKRILMPDDWVGHPLQRDYALTEESVQFKHGVKPKLPSQIIPYVQCNKKN